MYTSHSLHFGSNMKSITQVFAIAIGVTLAVLPHADAFGCKPTEVKGWMLACDRVTASAKAKCDDKLCHVALHRLVEQETIDCYVSSNLGPASDLAIYKSIDDFCHGEGPDPFATTAPAPTTTVPAPTTTAPVPTTTAPLPTTTIPATTTPVVTTSTPPTPTTTTPKPAC